MENKTLYVDGGGMSVHAPTAASMSQQEFIDLWIGRINWIHDHTAKVKFLTDKYKDCQNVMKPPKYRGNVPENAVDPESLDNTVESPEKKTVKTTKRKASEKIE
jgi:hypothetical protein